MRRWLSLYYIAGIIAVAQLIYKLILERRIDWFYLAILISQLGAIYAVKKEQKEQAAQ
ncbi:hypothetical protein [Terribacillus saccharophilus]|uniref:hypothetical protein n=1 Tax=Terribacillus saccharophilus TaxID=361277 RepID=UPI002DD0956D|nr:hypothetical protein [Terribacillus saccharophilus]MEC0291066.1 hypothetical protein [Terribacillus saccharophilus]MEC0301684.1 hypothetical protein [Terribacillus saccharophilus]